MGDVVSLVERAQELTTEQDAEKLQDRMLKGQFNLEDFLEQLQKIKQMGPLSQLMEMIPGLGAQMRQARSEISDDDYRKIEAIIHSMTSEERRRPDLLRSSRRGSHSRKSRIAKGCGRTTQDVNQLVTQFEQMQKMMTQMGQMAKRGKVPKSLRGMNLPFQ